MVNINLLESLEIRSFSARSIAELLLQNRAICDSGNRRPLGQSSTRGSVLQVFEKVIYFASIVDVDTDFSFCDGNKIVEFPSLNK
jgi:hypothetical protein